jgi:hypothetical protein
MVWKLKGIQASDRAFKKLVATFYDPISGKEKHTHFGAKGYDDFVHTGDVQARERYQTRHRKDLDTNDPTKAGYLSWYILWNKPTLSGSIRDYKSRFNM